MAVKKIKKNLYFDDRCTKRPFSVSVTLDKKRIYRGFATQDEAESYLEGLLESRIRQKMTRSKVERHFLPTKEPDVWVSMSGNRHAAIITIVKIFESKADAIKVRDKMMEISDIEEL